MEISNFDGVGMVEESWMATDLNHTSLSHSLVDNDVQYLTHSSALLSVGVVNVRCVDDKLSLMIDYQLYFSSLESGVDQECFTELLLSPQIKSRVDILANKHFDLLLLAIDNLVHLKLRTLVFTVWIISILSDAEWVLEHLWCIFTNFHPKLVR